MLKLLIMSDRRRQQDNPIGPMLPERPALQRTELGPVVHALGHQIADLAEPELLEMASDGGVVLYTASYRDFSRELGGPILNVLDGIIENNFSSPDLWRINRLPVRLGMGARRRDLTYARRTSLSLIEGTGSGVVMPIKLYGSLIAHDIMLSEGPAKCSSVRRVEHRLEQHHVDPDHFITTLSSPAVDTILRTMAHAPNGMYGPNSTNVHTVGLPRFLNPAASGRFAEGFHQTSISIFDHALGEEPRLSQDFLAKKKQLLTRARRDVPSGGCPVRHDTFTDIGPAALALFDELDIDPASLPRESLISRYRRLVVAVAQKALDAQTVVEHEDE